MKTKLITINYCIALMLFSLHCFCQLDINSNPYTYKITIPKLLPQKLFTDSTKKNKDSASFIFIEFGDGSFATSYTGIDSLNIKHHYKSAGTYTPVMFLSPTYDTTKRPKPAFFSKVFNHVLPSGNDQAILHNEEKLKITSSVSDSLILLSDSAITFAITYKLDLKKPYILKVNYGDNYRNTFSPIYSNTQTVKAANEFAGSGNVPVSTINAIRTYQNAIIKNSNDISGTSRMITFWIDSSLADGKEHSIFITLKTANVDITNDNHIARITAALSNGNGYGGRNTIESASLQMNVMAETNLVHDPNQLKSKSECIEYNKTDAKRLNITASYTLHVQNSGEGFVNKIETKTFIPAGLITPSYIDIDPSNYKPTNQPVEMQTASTSSANQKPNPGFTPPILSHTNTATVNNGVIKNDTVANTHPDTIPGFNIPIYHTGDLSISENTGEKPIDKRIKIDSISVHGVNLLTEPFYITQVDSLFYLPSKITHIRITAKYAHPFLDVNIKNENSDGTDPLLYPYQADTKNVTAEISFSLQTTRNGYSRMMSWSNAKFNDDQPYYTQPALVYMADECPCACIQQTGRPF